jgi:glycerol-3-phosphate acyltransferase PlsY
MQLPLLLILFGYLVGSIPFGLFIGLAKGIDVRQHGSGNIGSTNVGRVLGRKYGLICFLLDLLKGFLPVMAAGLVMRWWGMLFIVPSSAWLWLAVAVATVIGHVFPVWLKFKGGKGVATALGALMGIWPIITLPMLAALIVWLIVLGLTSFVSVASIVAALSAPLWLCAFLLHQHQNPRDFTAFFAVTTLLAIVIVYTHRSNIKRVIAGDEKKMIFKWF